MSQNNTLPKESASFLHTNRILSGRDILSRLKAVIPFFSEKKKTEELLLNSHTLMRDTLSFQDKIFHLEQNIHKSNQSFDSTQIEFVKEIRALVKNIEKEKLLVFQQKEFLDKKEVELNENAKEIRQTEIWITAKKTDIKKEFKEIREKESKIEEREQSILQDIQRLQFTESEILEKENYLSDRETLLAEKEIEFSFHERDFFEKKEQLKEKELELKEGLEKNLREKEELNKKLEEKIEEYEKKLSSLDKTKETIDLYKKDKSKEGKQEKLIVGEAIRQMQKICKDMLSRSEELEEKYCGGTFKGFALPLDEIVNKIETLKEHLTQIYQYAKENPHLPLNYYITEIELRLKKAEEQKELWEFPEAFTNAVEGLALCSGLEALLKTFSDWTSTSDDGESKEEKETNYYEDLGISPDAKQDEIKKAYYEKVKIFHPDKIDPNLSEEEKKSQIETFHRIQKAYEALCDIEKRKQYDKTQKEK